MKNIYVFLPCYNEADNIENLIQAWMAQTKDGFIGEYFLRLTPIDDCSTDNTLDIMYKMQKQYPENIHIIKHISNKNLRGGLNSAINYFHANADTEDLMCTMDGDNTHDPRYVTSMIDLLERNNLDCVIASRYQSGADVVGLSHFRSLMSDGAKLYYGLSLRVPNVKDYTCGYRVYSKESIDRLVEKFGAEPIQEKSFACMMEFLYKLYKSGSTFGEVGFVLRYDQKAGDSKMHVWKTALSSLTAPYKFRRLG